MTNEELEAEFPLGPDSLPQPGVPQGRLEHFRWTKSRIFPGTVRDCWIYVPAQYDPARPACVLVVQDGKAHWQPERRWRIPTILDNLIHQKAIPVLIGVFVDPGVVPATVPGGSERGNRSFEYDSPGDRYARFLLEEILPAVGRRYRLAQEGRSRAIMGGSSGGICAFNAAWERPDAFARVLSIVGSYTAMRGGHTLAPLVRLTEPKPLRVFQESGAADFKIYAGDWFVANQDLLSALTYAGYEVNHVWAEHAGHNDYHGSAILPAALRWLWQGHPAPITAGTKSQQPVMRVLIPGEAWRRVGGRYPAATALAADAQGGVVFASPADACLYRIGRDGRPKRWVRMITGVAALAFGPDGTLHACQPGKRRIVRISANGEVAVWLKGIDAAGLGFAANGNGYAADPVKRRVWLVAPNGRKRVVDEGIAAPRAGAVFGGQGQLIVTDARGPASWQFMIQPDGTLAHRAPYFPTVVPGGEADAAVVDVAVSAKGWPVFATRAGLQLGMQTGGLITGLISAPARGAVDGVAFGGTARDELFVSCGGKIYRRRINLADSLWG